VNILEEKRRIIFKGILVGVGTGTLVGLACFFFVSTRAGQGMGSTVFLLIPFAAGFATALVTSPAHAASVAAVISAAVSLVILVVFRLEGILCALLAFPLLLAGLLFGVLFGFLFRKYILDRMHRPSAGAGLMLALIPLTILAGQGAEQNSLQRPRYETISSSITLQAKPEEVWRDILSIDSIHAKRPWMMHVGLPIPVRCAFQRPGGVGAKRTCYFENGYIEETVVAWEPPREMRLLIDRTNMPGRHWLGFESAAYELERVERGTAITRTTTITSHLYPVWYWRYFERLGVATEHEYILSDLAVRISHH